LILDGTSLSIQVCLDAGKSTNDMDVSLDYLLWNTTGGPTKPASTRVATNGTTDVTVLGAGSISANFVADLRRKPHDQEILRPVARCGHAGNQGFREGAPGCRRGASRRGASSASHSHVSEHCPHDGRGTIGFPGVSRGLSAS